MAIQDLDYTKILKSVFEKRHNSDSSYSLRSFAKDLDTSPSRISEVFNYKKGISPAAAKEMAKKLKMDKSLSTLFITMVEAKQSKNPKEQKKAKERLGTLLKQKKFNSKEQLQTVVANWYHSAILELFELNDFEIDPNKIAKRLGITKHKVQNALERLIDLGFLVKDGDGLLQRTNKINAKREEITDQAIQQYHEEMLLLANESLIKLPKTKKNFSEMTFGIDSKKMPELNRLIREFRKEVSSLVSRSQTKDSLFNLSIHLFQLDKSHNQEQ